MKTPTLSNTPWKDLFLQITSDPNYFGCGISSIRAASFTFSTQEKLQFLESLAQVLCCINQATHFYLESCSQNQRVDVRDNLLSHDEKRDLIEQRNFIHKLPSTIKNIFLSTDKENDKNLENGNNEDDKLIGKRINNKNKDLQKFKLKAKESF